MKNIALSLFLVLLISACSSGSTVADIPGNVTGLYSGTFENTAGTEGGRITLNIIEDESGEIVGNVLFESNDNTCLVNGSVTGYTSSFSVDITADQAFDVTVTTVSGSVSTTTSYSGEIRYIFTQSNSGRTLSGTYITTGDICSNFTGAGTATLSR